MQNITSHNALIYLHGAVLLFAFAGLFGVWLNLPATIITLGRTLTAALCLLLLIKIFPQYHRHIAAEHKLPLIGVGILLALHWLSFFVAIQLSNITIALFTFACYPLFTALIAPLFGQALTATHLLQSGLILVGMAVLLPWQQAHITATFWLGVVSGLLSALTFAIISLLNKQLLLHYHALLLAKWQNVIASVVLLPWLLLEHQAFSVNSTQLLQLLLLGTVFTALAHSLFNLALVKISAQQASIAVSLEPVYGAALAYVLIAQPLSIQLVIGGSMIVFANVWGSLTAKNQR